MENEPKTDQQGTNERPLQMDDQGTSYSSSYNESTLGEVEENRRASLDERDQEERAHDTDQQR